MGGVAALLAVKIALAVAPRPGRIAPARGAVCPILSVSSAGSRRRRWGRSHPGARKTKIPSPLRPQRTLKQIVAENVVVRLRSVASQSGVRSSANMWKSAETAPFDEDITVLVSDARKGPYVLLKPCRRTKEGWVVSGKKTPLAVMPLKWMPLQRSPRRGRFRRAGTALERARQRSSTVRVSPS
jgi:hypothetical protein